MAKKFFFTLHTGYVGSTSHEVVEFADDVTEKELDDYAWGAAVQNAETYGIYPRGDYDEEEESEDWDADEYSDNIEGYWVPYVPEDHDMYAVGGKW